MPNELEAELRNYVSHYNNEMSHESLAKKANSETGLSFAGPAKRVELRKKGYLAHKALIRNPRTASWREVDSVRKSTPT